ncbi:hypothetical protein [Janthinobacterium fluminis]|uniref:Uncharacterized protein n=1 Tax=Janthinobacterium fluminis TaxID=2987524 RepID=A0ABT5JTL7_9BURK|nr:hypothetical protein [Janthinobacterium fluminis]MDC8756091.1 hypothetical protein [Janthinobacterium fluminis]
MISLVLSVMLLATFSTSLIDRSVARSREIEGVFIAAAMNTDKFYVANSRLPTPEEFRTLISVEEGSPLMLSAPPFDAGIVAEAGKSPPSGFVLEYWRGEWTERYISWTKHSTLKLDASQYFIFQSQLAQAVLMFGIASLCVATSILTWPNKSASTRLRHSSDSTE